MVIIPASWGLIEKHLLPSLAKGGRARAASGGSLRCSISSMGGQKCSYSGLSQRNELFLSVACLGIVLSVITKSSQAFRELD